MENIIKKSISQQQFEIGDVIIKKSKIFQSNDPSLRKTKIICTIGPSSCSTEILGKLLDCGMNVCRLNFSHGDHKV